MAPDSPGFLEELKRRHVWRVAAAYAVAGWLVVQIATQVFPFFNIPNWAVRLVVILIAIGFPIAVAFAWIFELTPEGIRRTAPADSPDARPEHARRQLGRKLNALIVAVLVLAVALLGWRLFAVRHEKPSTLATATLTRSLDSAQRTAFAGLQTRTAKPARRVSDMDVANNPGNAAPASAAEAAGSGLHAAQTIPTKSVAVLPFANESGDKDEQYFSDGLSEDLITALSQFAGLKVISRNSAFQFRDSKDSSAKIGQLLGVAHLLEGSVQRAGDEVRISATLVNASDGSTLWSRQYDRPYKDLFKLQDAITKSVADALKAKLLTATGAVVQSDRPPSGNLAAYNAFLQGNFHANTLTEADQRKALDFYQQAIHLDPRYALAYTQIAMTWINLAGNFALPPEQSHAAYAKARAAVSAALKLEPGLAAAYSAKGWVLSVADFDWAGAASAYQQAARLAPKNAASKSSLAASMATLGHPRQAVALLRQALVLNPLCAGCYDRLARVLPALDQLGAAEQAARKVLEIDPTGYFTRAQLVYIDVLRGDAKSALHDAAQEPAGPWRDLAMAYALQIGGDRTAADAALQRLIESSAGSSAFQIAEVYALRHDPDNMFKWLERARTNHDPGIQLLLTDVAILRYRNDPRFATFCKKVGLPTTTDAVAMK